MGVRTEDRFTGDGEDPLGMLSDLALQDLNSRRIKRNGAGFKEMLFSV
jgi:hypothetical protein